MNALASILKESELQAGLGFGRKVEGLKMADLADEAVRARLREIWIEDGLVIFTGAEVTAEFQVALSRVFGDLEQHPVRELWTEGMPELITIRFDPEKERILEVDGVRTGSWLPWHSDLIYTDRINHGGVLRMLQKTSWGGKTGFLDRIQAYALMPEDLKRQIEGLNIVYRLMVFHHETRYGAKSQVRTLQTSEFQRKVSERIDRDFPPVSHPLVFTQAETGRKVLNLSPHFALYIEGRDDPEGHALLQRVVDHMTSCPAYFHDWRPDDLVLWDNWRMVHSVTGAPADEVRIVQRTTIAGDYALGRKAA